MTATETFDVGWFMYDDLGAHMFPAPRPGLEAAPAPLSRKAVQACPSVRDVQARSFDLLSPYNLDIAVERSGEKYRIDLNLARSSVALSAARDVVVPNERRRWRHPDRPVLQISVPYCFFSDVDATLTQTAPIGGESLGENVAVISGRYAIRNWIRPMSVALEFRRTPARLTVRRNDPLCTLLFDGPTPSASPRLVRARKTEALVAFTAGCAGVTSKISDTASAMARAATVRPKTLLEPADE